MRLHLYVATEGYLTYEVLDDSDYALCEAGFTKEGRFGGHITYFNRESEAFDVKDDTDEYHEIKARAIEDYNRLKAEGQLEEYW